MNKDRFEGGFWADTALRGARVLEMDKMGLVVWTGKRIRGLGNLLLLKFDKEHESTWFTTETKVYCYVLYWGGDWSTRFHYFMNW